MPNRGEPGGIYAIRNTANNRVYVGAASSISRRWHGHRARLRVGAHKNRDLQDDWFHFGEQSFVFEVLEEVQGHALLGSREVYWLDSARRGGDTYNKSRFALGLNYRGRAPGRPMSISLPAAPEAGVARALRKRRGAVGVALRPVAERITKDELMSYFRAAVAAAGSQAAFARQHGIPSVYVGDVLRGRRSLATRILDALGVERVEYYRDKRRP